MPAQTGTKVVKSVKIHHTDCVCEGYQPPWGGVGPDAALLLVPVDPGEGAVGAHAHWAMRGVPGIFFLIFFSYFILLYGP